MSELDQSESALRENISKKGKNAYYYAHGNTPTGPAWDGREEPRLLAVSAEVTFTKPLASQFDSFSWLDETKSVKVYIDFENAHEVEDENISLVRDAIDNCNQQLYLNGLPLCIYRFLEAIVSNLAFWSLRSNTASTLVPS